MPDPVWAFFMNRETITRTSGAWNYFHAKNLLKGGNL